MSACRCVEPEECSSCSKDAEIARLKAEVERLRKALAEYEGQYFYCEKHGHEQTEPCPQCATPLVTGSGERPSETARKTPLVTNTKADGGTP